MQTFMIFVSGIVTGIVLSFAGMFARGYYMVHKSEHNPSLPDQGGKVVFNTDGYAYWRNETGFFKALIISDDEVDFENSVEIDPMNVPADELHMLMEIMSRLE